MARPKYRVKARYQGKRIATSTGHLIAGDFHNRYANGDQIIEQNPEIARFFETTTGAPVDVDERASEAEQASEASESSASLVGKSTELNVRDALKLMRKMSAEELAEFTEGEERETVLQAAAKGSK